MSDIHSVATPFLAPLFIGMVFATSLHGISILQTWYYYTHQNDNWPLKSLVAAVMVCNTVHEIIITHTVYMYGVAYWGDMTMFLTIIWSLVLQALFSGVTTFLVQSFMVMRLWRLSKRNIPLTVFTSLIVLAQLVSAFTISVLAVQRPTIEGQLVLRPWSSAVITLAAFGDVIIAVALCTLLHRSRTGWKRSDTMITKLIVFTINTGLVTSLYAVASFIAYMSASSPIYVGFYFSVARLYTNALLASLNVRKSIRNAGDNIDTDAIGKVTLSLRSFSNPDSSLQSGPPNISINIDTTKETITDTMHDQEQTHDKEKTARLQTSRTSLVFDIEDKKYSIL